MSAGNKYTDTPNPRSSAQTSDTRRFMSSGGCAETQHARLPRILPSKHHARMCQIGIDAFHVARHEPCISRSDYI
jgi:hypothetical protein